MKNRELAALTEKSFEALDLQLYIDTHPDDSEAIMKYNESVRALAILQNEFEKAHGPLYSFTSLSNESRFTWVDAPWPWERNDR